MTSKTEVASGEFQRRTGDYLDLVVTTGETLVVTRYGKPIAEVTKIEPKRLGRDLLGSMEGRIVFNDDLTEPAFGPEEWTYDEANVAAGQ